ncbi:breast cancer type 1 susceptibility protein homolog isoform x2 [Plasmopara halstedii]|uniref:RING-type E3 ubiquitin transferase BRCA1 n=1 Tax=Plasmopara halstedii TaxID=4781 RepID=A0A0P1AN09_PLAHL|nr:breast cancer type 1 susceptibility protein homolog isoform x2 [Plasmopara halstedii]CEG42745.1 breast cancer type 1 susceptibility protein homolog isoform x2 [Plasmopara halstedii]|eukprot:XP_024579114.1 breast cancer type 1 susceptibility protein homolog isoform x2 [Plasmopara halstedii]
MALLSSRRLEAVRLIREQLRCTLCNNIFQEPQCLDCKHNFCLPCILQHLKQNKSHCPTCQLPTRPSEVTRNQFLESILVAWNNVETELKALHGDPKFHATKITIEDTDKVLQRVAHGVSSSNEEERHKSRGPVANNKWNIDTQEIRQELNSERPYLPQHYGTRHESTNQWKKTSSSDLPLDYSSSTRRKSRKRGLQKNQTPRQEVEQMSESESSQNETKEESEVTLSNSLMATQDVENYLERIKKQREALSQWEREHQNQTNKTSLFLDLERSLHSSNTFEALLQERRESQQHEEDGDLLTQMTQLTQLPPATSVLESPDLLATFRQSRHRNDDDRLIAKRRLFLASPSRKRLRMPTLQGSKYQAIDCKSDLVSDTSNIDRKEVSDSLSAMAFPNEEVKNADDDTESGDADAEEEYEMKPAKPLQSTLKNRLSHDQFRQSQKKSIPRKDVKISENFRCVSTSFTSAERTQSDSLTSQAAKNLTLSTPHSNAANDKASKSPRKTYPTQASKPPVHTSNHPKVSIDTRESTSHFVFVSSDLTREEVKHVLEATQRLGGKFGHDFDLKRDPTTNRYCTSVTHLITKAVPPIGVLSEEKPRALRCKRTAKYMRALAEGTFVMDFSWITASLAAGRWLTEDPFEMVGDIYSDAVGKPHEGHIRRIQTGRRNSIFSLFCFVLLVSEDEFEFQFASVKTLVNNFGGTVVRAGSSGTFQLNEQSRRTPVGVVSKTTLPSEAKAKWYQFHIPIVRITWIFDSVSHLEVLPFDDYYPY